MELSRRDFLKIGGAGVGGATIFGLFNPQSGLAVSDSAATIPLHKIIGETTTICPYCGVGCGFVVASENGSLVNLEGDPEHPINQGGACAKGGAQFQLSAHNPLRVNKVRYRAPGSSNWEEKSYTWAFEEIAKRIKKTRDDHWVEKDKAGFVVNRTEAIASLGGASLDNEEGYLICKLMRAIGVVYLEHQARI
ncbi:MAG TPA: twin-arginine translocation signal domain-containing protein [Dehalococcoidia bacterium]|nr:twin-arginine translocation signal domain-containing protein [Dehalococcoidia bacterium]